MNSPQFRCNALRSLIVRLFDGNDLLRRKPFAKDLAIAPAIAVETQVQLRVKAEVIPGMLPAKSGDRRQFMEIGAQRHGLQAHLDAALQEQVQPAAKSVVRAGLARHPLIGFPRHSVNGHLYVAGGYFLNNSICSRVSRQALVNSETSKPFFFSIR